MLYSEQPTVLLARRHLNTMILTNFENLNPISNIFQKIHDFLILKDPVIIYIHSKTTDRHFLDQGIFRHSNSKLLKCYLIQTLNIFQNSSLWIFAARKASLVPFTLLFVKFIFILFIYLFILYLYLTYITKITICYIVFKTRD